MPHRFLGDNPSKPVFYFRVITLVLWKAGYLAYDGAEVYALLPAKVCASAGLEGLAPHPPGHPRSLHNRTWGTQRGTGANKHEGGFQKGAGNNLDVTTCQTQP